MKIKTLALCAVLATGIAAGAQAAVIPAGVQNDVSLATVTGAWGWTQISASNYGGGLAVSDLFAGHKKYVMIAAMREGSGVIDVLAADLYTTVTTHTAQDATNVSNSVGWYFNGNSMGFAGADDTICQNSADTCGMDERDRLSWHTSSAIDNWTQDSGIAPAYVFNGWRSGDNNDIYEGTDWMRMVFTTDGLDSGNVPEPGSLALLGIGALGVALSRRRQAGRKA